MFTILKSMLRTIFKAGPPPPLDLDASNRIIELLASKALDPYRNTWHSRFVAALQASSRDERLERFTACFESAPFFQGPIKGALQMDDKKFEAWTSEWDANDWGASHFLVLGFSSWDDWRLLRSAIARGLCPFIQPPSEPTPPS